MTSRFWTITINFGILEQQLGFFIVTMNNSLIFAFFTSVFIADYISV